MPVIAAGGVADASDAQKLIDLGASGVLCGSRFVASRESDTHQRYKQAITDASGNATVRSTCYDLGWPDAPHRTLVNSTFLDWQEARYPNMGERPGEGDTILTTADGMELPRYIVIPPSARMTGDITASAMYAGTGVDRIESVISVREIVDEFSTVLT